MFSYYSYIFFHERVLVTRVSLSRSRVSTVTTIPGNPGITEQGSDPN